jgi:hypothetical protein
MQWPGDLPEDSASLIQETPVGSVYEICQARHAYADRLSPRNNIILRLASSPSRTPHSNNPLSATLWTRRRHTVMSGPSVSVLQG